MPPNVEDNVTILADLFHVDVSIYTSTGGEHCFHRVGGRLLVTLYQHSSFLYSSVQNIRDIDPPVKRFRLSDSDSVDGMFAMSFTSGMNRKYFW